MFDVLKILKKNKASKIKKCIFYIILLILLSIFLFKTNKKILNIIHTPTSPPLSSKDICVHQSYKIIINIYNTMGNVKFKLTAYRVQNFLNQKITCFIYPNITIFNEENVAIWKIKANQAKIQHDNIYLYGYIYINNLIQSTYLQSIITNHAVINLTTQEVLAPNKVIIHGHCFYSIGTQMYANLRTQTAKLMNNTQTYYEIKYIS